MWKIAIHRSKYPPRLWLCRPFWQFPVLKNFPEHFQVVRFKVLINNYFIRKHQKLQRPGNTNKRHWRRELKWSAENAKITHHDDNFNLYFFSNMTAASIMLVRQTERVNIGTFSCFICYGSFTIQSRIIVHGKKI